MSDFIQIEERCRICLGKKELCGQIFNIKIPNSDGTRLTDFLTQLTDLKFSENDGFPSKICFTCVELSLSTHYLIKTINNSYASLMSWKENGKLKIIETFYKDDLKISKDDNLFQSIIEENEVLSGIFIENGNKEEISESFIKKSNGDSSMQDDYGCFVNVEESCINEIKEDREIIENDLQDSSTEVDRIGTQIDDGIDFSDDFKRKMENDITNINVYVKNDNPDGKKKQINNKSIKDLRPRKKNLRNCHSCDVCSKEFTSKKNLQRHITMHDLSKAKKTHKCQICEKEFLYRSILIQHMPVHTNEKRYLCNHCGNSYRSKSSLNSHTKVHTGERPFQCEICNQSFRIAGNLCEHMMKHNDVRPFICEVCGTGFRRSADLKVHLRNHSGEKLALCNLCGKGFTTTGQLNIHIRSHTGEKPYKCNWCSKEFSSKTSLLRHNRIHTGERPYTCHICCKTFNQSNALKTHKLIHGGMEKVKMEVPKYCL